MSHTWEGGFHESATSYYAAVGYLCNQWGNVEHFVYSLGAVALHMPLSMHGILFRHMGVVSVLSFIQDYVAEHHAATHLEQVQHIKAYVDRCRKNRNLIVHSTPRNSDEGAPILRTSPDKNRKVSKEYPISVEMVRNVCDECETAGWLLIRAQFFLSPQKLQDDLKATQFWEGIEPTLFLKPPLPADLGANPHIARTLQDPPLSSDE